MEPEAPSPSVEVAFALKQHDFLRKEIQDVETEARTLERYAMIAVAAIWTWTAKEAPSIGCIIGIISLAIGLLGGLRMWALWTHIATKGDYVAEIEERFRLGSLQGWENYLREIRQGKGTASRRKWYYRPRLIGYTSGIFWLALIVSSIPFGIFIQNNPGPEKPLPTIKVECFTPPTATPRPAPKVTPPK